MYDTQENKKPIWFDIFLNGQLHTRLSASSLQEANTRARKILSKHKDACFDLIQVAKRGILVEGKDYASIRQGKEAEMICR